MSDTTASEQGWLLDGTRRTQAEPTLGLVLAWSLVDPGRVGQLALLPSGHGRSVLGRGEVLPDDPGTRLFFGQHRPGTPVSGDALRGSGLSRVQLVFETTREGLRVQSVGRAPLFVNDRRVGGATLSVGDVLHVERLLLLLVVSRKRGELSLRCDPPTFPFGGADPFGLVGESPRVWSLRDELDFLSRRSGHALLFGPSGAGKELCARSMHGLSSRARGPFVARNAATLPPGLIDAELFGSARNYPHAGLPARAGLLGEAEGGTLFLDEIAELPEDLQAHLLRVLDDGEYHRLGDEKTRRADVRFVGATNREPSALKHDLLARFTVRVQVPGLGERREDIPLLVRALLERHAKRDEPIRARFFEGDHPRIDPLLMSALLSADYRAHVRELDALLVASMATSKGPYLALSPAVQQLRRPASTPAVAALSAPNAPTLPVSRAEIEQALRQTDGNVSQAFRALGLSSRDTLRRLMKKYGIDRA